MTDTFEIGRYGAAQRWALERRLAGDSAGETWLARPVTGGPPVTVRISRGSGHPDEMSWWDQHFARVRGIRHPGLAPVVDAFVAGAPQKQGDPVPPGVFRYVLEEHVDGSSLDGSGVSPAQQLELLAAPAAGLDELHRHSLAHGGVTPANIVVRNGHGVLVGAGTVEFVAPVAPSPYLAPELLVPTTAHGSVLPSVGADVFAFAATAAQAVLGESLPTTPSGELDISAVAAGLRAAAPNIAEQLLDGLDRRIEVRPTQLVPWLRSIIAGAGGPSTAPAGGAETLLLAGDPALAEPVANSAVDGSHPDSATPDTDTDTEMATPLSAAAPIGEPSPVAAPAAAAPPPTTPSPMPSPMPAASPASPPPAPPAPPAAKPMGGEPASGRRFSKSTLIAAAVTVVVLLGGGGIALALTSGSGKPKQTAASSAPVAAAPLSTAAAPSTAAVSSDPVSSAPSDSVVPSASDNPASGSAGPSTPAGDSNAPAGIVLSSDQMNAACGQDMQANVQSLTPQGIVVLACQDSSDDYQGLAAVEAKSDTVLWNRNDLTDSSSDLQMPDNVTAALMSGGTDHLYFVNSTDHPAKGLKQEYTTRTVQEVDTKTGKDVWTSPLPDADNEDAPQTVEEQPVAGGDPIVIVEGQAWVAYDVKTGKQVWHKPDGLSIDGDSSAQTLGVDDRAIVVENNDNGNPVLVCTDMATNKRVWSAPLPADDSIVDLQNSDWEVDGTTLWFTSSSGAAAFNVDSGKQLQRQDVPARLQNALVTPTLTAALDGSKLALFHTGSWTKPIWSQPADSSTTTYLITPSLVVVTAPAGTQVLSTKDGSILPVGSVFDDATALKQSSITDGMIIQSAGLVNVD